MRALALVAVVTLLFSGHAMADGKPPYEVGRMKVTIMPEYDSSAVLVIQEGKFADRTAFPKSVSFTLPKEVTKLTDVCSLSPGGHHFCQLFKLDYGAEDTKLNIKLPYSDFFIDYQYAPFTVSENSVREFSFPLDTTNSVKTLEAHIQEPYRSERFTVTPTPVETYKKDGFNYHKFIFKDIKAGERKFIKVSYSKKDIKPSVDEMYSAMLTPSLFSENSGEIMLVLGLATLGLLWFFRRRKGNAVDDI